MPREHGRVLSRIWRDKEFRALTVSGQRMYVMLLSQANVSNAGTLPLQISKLVKGCDDTSDEDVRAALEELARMDFSYFDEDTEEILIRSYIRNDGVLKQPNIMKNALRCAAALESDYLRAAMAVELRRIGRADSRATADEMDPSGTALDDFSKAHETLLESFSNPLRVSEPLANPGGKGKGRGVSPVGTYSPSKDKNTPATSLQESDRFDEFWAAYPIRRDRRKAETAFAKALKRGAVEEIIAGAHRYAADPGRDPKFTKYAEGWLNGDGWLDEPLPVRGQTRQMTSREQSFLDLERMKDNPNPEVLRRAGLEPSQPQFRAIQGGAQ